MKRALAAGGDFLRGVRAVRRAMTIIRAPALRRYVMVPLALNVACSAAGLYLLDQAITELMKQLPPWLDWLRFLTVPLVVLLGLVAVFFGFSILANVLASPFNGTLSAAVERHLRGELATGPVSLVETAAEILRSVYGELRKILYYARWVIPALVLSLVPVLNVLAAPVWLALGAWMLAIEYLDGPYGNHGQAFPAVRTALRQRRTLALGYGGAMSVVTLVPVLNFVAVPIGVAAATLLYVEELAPRPPAGPPIVPT